MERSKLLVNFLPIWTVRSSPHKCGINRQDQHCLPWVQRAPSAPASPSGRRSCEPSLLTTFPITGMDISLRSLERPRCWLLDSATIPSASWYLNDLTPCVAGGHGKLACQFGDRTYLFNGCPSWCIWTRLRQDPLSPSSALHRGLFMAVPQLRFLRNQQDKIWTVLEELKSELPCDGMSPLAEQAVNSRDGYSGDLRDLNLNVTEQLSFFFLVLSPLSCLNRSLPTLNTNV